MTPTKAQGYDDTTQESSNLMHLRSEDGNQMNEAQSISKKNDAARKQDVNQATEEEPELYDPSTLLPHSYCDDYKSHDD